MSRRTVYDGEKELLDGDLTAPPPTVQLRASIVAGGGVTASANLTVRPPPPQRWKKTKDQLKPWVKWARRVSVAWELLEKLVQMFRSAQRAPEYEHT